MMTVNKAGLAGSGASPRRAGMCKPSAESRRHRVTGRETQGKEGAVYPDGSAGEVAARSMATSCRARSPGGPGWPPRPCIAFTISACLRWGTHAQP
jgi:hypothetical protein